MYAREKQHNFCRSAKPKLIATKYSASPDNQGKICNYAVTFEDTIVLRSSNFQFSDVITLYVWSHNSLLSLTPKKRKPIAQCNLNVGDIYTSLSKFYLEQKKHQKYMVTQRVEVTKKLSQATNKFSTERMMSVMEYMRKMNTLQDQRTALTKEETMLTPPMEEFSLMKEYKKRSKKLNLRDSIANELAMIKEAINETSDVLESCSSSCSDYDEVDLIENENKSIEPKFKSKAKHEKYEELYGQVFLSFFPIKW